MTLSRSSFHAVPVYAALSLLPLVPQTRAPLAKPPQVDAKVVTMAVTVRGKHGVLVPDLTKDDFTLTQDGRAQTIQEFKSGADVPLTLGLLIDTGLNQGDAVAAERTASQHFLDQMLTGSPDKGFIIQFDREVDLLADLTGDKAKLRAAVDQLGSPQYNNTGNSQNSDNTSHHLGGSGTVLYDAIYLASREVMQKQPGRKALVVLTDGVDRGSKETLFSAIEAAQRANTAVYAIYSKGPERSSNNENNGYPGSRRGGTGGGWPGGGYPGGGPGSGGSWPGGGGSGGRRSSRPTEGSRIDGRKVLEQICSETGGYMFEANKKKSVDQDYSSITDELHAQYVLSYSPDKQSAYSGYHKVVLTTKKKNLYVQTRQGYYSGE